VVATRTAPRETVPVSLRRRLDALLRGSPAFLPALICVGIFIWFAGDEGGFRGTTFLPGTLLLLALLAVSLATLPRPRPPRLVIAAVALLGAYAAWSYLSILWAEEQGLAWDGANRTVLYAVVLALFALWPMRADAAVVILGALGLGVAALGLVELLRVENAARAIQYFHEGRLSEPTGYANANVALWFSAFWPCVLLAGRREVPSLLRGLFLGAAALLAALALLGQSRGWLFVLPVMLPLFVAIVPGRGRVIAALTAVGAGVALMLGPLLEVYDAFDSKGPPGPAYSDAVRSILLVGGGLIVVGFLAGLADRRVQLGERASRRVSAALVGLLILACAGGLAGFAVAKGNPVTELSDAWGEFKQGGTEPGDKSSRFGTTLATYRYDYWRVAWQNFERRPLVGIGADNFGREYARRGESDQTPRYPHSVVLRALSQTGVVGALLLGGAIVAAFAAALPALRLRLGLAGAAAGGGLTLFAYFLVQGSLDWFWEFPALGAMAFAMLGLATAVAGGARSGAGRALPGGRVAAAAAALVGAVLAVGLLLPWLAERDLRGARSIAGSDPAGAIGRLDRAATLNPLSPLPDKTAGVIEAVRGRLEAARQRFRDVLAQDPKDPYAWMQLGAIASVQMRERDALRYVRRARALAPRDRVAAEVMRELERGNVVTPERLNRLALANIDERIGPE
jgi:tetratricopeptide (TPR) repeat protein